MEILYSNLGNLTWQQVVMWAIGGLLIYLAIAKDMEPSLLLPMGFGAILVNLPMSGAIDQWVSGQLERGALSVLYDAGIANELFPLILFIGIGAMIDFGPLLTNPKLMIFGAAAQFGIFFTLCLAGYVRFDLTGRGVHRHHRRCRRTDGYRCGAEASVAVSGRHHGCGVFLHGAGADHPAAGHPAADDKEGAADPHAL